MNIIKNTPSASKTARSPALDVIRLIALFSVVFVHFFLNTDYYSIIVSGSRMYVATLLRCGAMVCVPLFIVLSGYLMKNRTPSRKYYSKLLKTLSVFVLASFCCIIYKIINYTGNNDMSAFFINEICNIFSYKAAPYGWYVEMYIGLFLIIPYLNILYNSLASQESRRYLILVFLLLTSFPGLVNSISLQIIPEWWAGIYPVTYYFIGVYLHDYPLKLKKLPTLLIYLAIFLFSGSYSFYQSIGNTFVRGSWQSHESILVVIQTVLIFHFFLQIDYSCMSKRTTQCLNYLSDLCFAAYLVSWIFDEIFYKTAGISSRGQIYRLEYIIIIVPAVYICSLLLSSAINFLYHQCAHFTTYVHKVICSLHSTPEGN